MILDISLLSVIVIGLTEVIKRAAGLNKRFVPLLAVAISVILGATGIALGITNINIIEAIVAGLMACGLFSSVKNTIGK